MRALLCLTLASGLACSKERREHPEASKTQSSEKIDSVSKDVRKDASIATTSDATPFAPQLRELGSSALEGGLQVEGDLERAFSWDDARGKNIVAFSSHSSAVQQGEHMLASRFVFVSHFARGESGWKTMRVVRGKILDCAQSISFVREEQARGLTDLDHDGVAELSLVYEIGCRADSASAEGFAPARLKVLLLEGGEKYALRAMTQLSSDAEPDFQLDPIAEDGPEVFKKHLIALWKWSRVDGPSTRPQSR